MKGEVRIMGKKGGEKLWSERILYSPVNVCGTGGEKSGHGRV